ncbi:CGNR zinc finger domain-containing protein [Metabacillus fastidiosus]|uniref:CGNR zinc finger domain-containing protein n=1 Tax=Metabacillus fastidiosus TaxID=1458 RepID=UPI002DBE26A1|nr:CGNR zinc finger domain-containing protein [Metabacillus fastidiosus]MEC2076214.1 CGNR zinc finger domain-containing protein [Metabacillus fastidiosus]
MKEESKFPLITGNIALDLVNTELVRRGQRHDLLHSEGELLEWLKLMREKGCFHKLLLDEAEEQIHFIFPDLINFRALLRVNFEAIADGKAISDFFFSLLEDKIEQAPFIYKLHNNKLLSLPIGSIGGKIISIIALDVLKLIEANKLQKLKKCSNPDCVLLFIDETGRRKWCSMKICGNRNKAARFQQKKFENS